MECKKVQDRLLTGYGDKELDPKENTGVERHLNECRDCRGFFKAVQKSAVIPFKEAGQMQPESVVWQRIQEKIEAEQARSGPGFWERLDALIPFLKMPQPVFRAAFAAALILVCVVLAKWTSGSTDPVYGYISEQMTFMSDLGTGGADLWNEDLTEDGIFAEEVEP